ncbi:MAG: DUF1883 domain-containing protein [Acidimicrobiia bacterium]
MNYLKYDLDLDRSDTLEVTLDKQANVRLLDQTNYQKYKTGASHKYYGGLAKKSPVRLSAPSSGHWMLVIDLGGRPGRVRASVRTLASGTSGPARTAATAT